MLNVIYRAQEKLETNSKNSCLKFRKQVKESKKNF